MKPHRTRTLLTIAFECAVFFGAWWLFVGSLNLGEIIVGAIGTGLAVLASHLVGARIGARFWGNVRAIGQVWRLPWIAASDTFAILQILAKHLVTNDKAESLFRAVHYADCGRSDADEMMQALAIAYTSATPKFVVIDIDTRQKVMLFHQLHPTDVPRMTENLGARP